MGAVLTTLGSAGIAAAAALAGVWLQSRLHRRTNDATAREKAYVDLLVASVGIGRRVSTLLATLQARSGMTEGLSVTLGIQAPTDARELHDWMDADYQPLMDAWSRVWTVGTPAAVELSNKLVDECASVLASLAVTPPITLGQRVRRTVVGVDTGDMLLEWQQRMKSLAIARKELANLVRRETGRPSAALFLDG